MFPNHNARAKGAGGALLEGRHLWEIDPDARWRVDELARYTISTDNTKGGRSGYCFEYITDFIPLDYEVVYGDETGAAASMRQNSIHAFVFNCGNSWEFDMDVEVLFHDI